MRRPGPRAIPALGILVGLLVVCGCRPGTTDATAEAAGAPSVEAAAGSASSGMRLPEGGMAHAASVPLADGRLLLVGGLGPDGRPTPRAVLVDPDGGNVRPAGRMDRPRVGHAAVALAGPDGRAGTPDDEVLVIGGYDGGETLDSLELWTPAASGGSFELLDERMPGPIARHAAVALAPANRDPGHPFAGADAVLVCGGVTDLAGDRVLLAGSFVVRLLPGHDVRVRTVAPPRHGRVDHTLDVLPGPDGTRGTADDRVLVYGGYGCDPDRTPATGEALRVLADGEVFDLLAETWIPLVEHRYDAGEEVPADLGGPRRGHASVALPDGRILLVGGSASVPDAPDAPRPLRRMAEVFTPDPGDPAGGTFHPAGEVVVPRIRPTVLALADGRVVVSGGIGPSGRPVEAVEAWVPAARAPLDPLGEGFHRLTDLEIPRAFHAAWPADRRSDGVLQLGGLDGTGRPVPSVESVPLP